MRLSVLKKTFGEIVKDRRTVVGLSQEALAFKANLDRKFVHQIEQGIHQPALFSIWKLAKALECAPSELLSKTEEALQTMSSLRGQGLK